MGCADKRLGKHRNFSFSKLTKDDCHDVRLVQEEDYGANRHEHASDAAALPAQNSNGVTGNPCLQETTLQTCKHRLPTITLYGCSAQVKSLAL